MVSRLIAIRAVKWITSPHPSAASLYVNLFPLIFVYFYCRLSLALYFIFSFFFSLSTFAMSRAADHRRVSGISEASSHSLGGFIILDSLLFVLSARVYSLDVLPSSRFDYEFVHLRPLPLTEVCYTKWLNFVLTLSNIYHVFHSLCK